MPRTLPASRSLRPDAAHQQLHHARALLLGDALRHGAAVDQDHHQQDEEGDEGDRLPGLLLVVGSLQDARGQRCRCDERADLRGGEPELGGALGEPHPLHRAGHDGGDVGLGLGLPHEPLAGDDQHVDVSVAHSGLPRLDGRIAAQLEPGVIGTGGVAQGGCEGGRGRARDARLHVRRPVVQRGHDHARQDDGDDRDRGDHERAAMQALRDLAPRDEDDRSPAGVHRPTASWKRSDSAGGSRLKRVSSPAERASVDERLELHAVGELEPGATGLGREDTSVGDRRDPAAGSAEADGEIAPAGRRAQALELAVQDHAPVVDHDDVLADVLDEVELMAGEQHRRAAERQVADHLRQRLDAERIETGERLVEHQRHRIVHERRGELHPLLVAVRERVQPRLPPLPEPQPRQPAIDAGGGRAAIQPRQPRQVLELSAHPHVRIQAALLRHVAEAQTRLAVDRRAGPADLTPVGLDEAEDAAHRRRLARPVRAQQADDAPRTHRQAAAVERRDIAVALDQAGDLQPEAAGAERRTVGPAWRSAAGSSAQLLSPQRPSRSASRHRRSAVLVRRR